jgi:outer membrane immunogenic protein
MRVAVVALLLSSLATGSAVAAPRHKPPAMPARPPVFSWAGFYIGLQGGYTQGHTSGPFSNADGSDSTPYSIRADSGFVGAHLGYNWQMGSLVYGLEGDINYFNLNNNQIIPDIPPVVDSVAAKETYNGDVRGRVGWAFDRLLAYAAGGLAFGNVQTAYTQFGQIPAPYLTTTTERTGWTAGGGLEYALTEHWLKRIEYRHTDLGRRSFVNADPAIDTADSVKFTTDLVLAALSYKF